MDMQNAGDNEIDILEGLSALFGELNDSKVRDINIVGDANRDAPV